MTAAIAITLLALVQYFFFGALVSLARKKYDVPAPKTTGNDAFERMNRVHLNTLERLALFLPLLWIAALHLPQLWLLVLGATYLLGRLVYWRGYVKAPQSRSAGTVLTMLPIAALFVACVVGLVQRLMS